MLISLKSNNPDYSWVIVKNPNSPALGRSLRKGSALGWYHEDAYHTAFFECVRTSGTVSFGRNPSEEFHYLYDAEFCDPYLALCLVTEYYRDVISKDLNSKDLVAEHSLTITSLRMGKIIDKMGKYLNVNFEVLDECEHWKNYQVIKLYATATLKDFLSNSVLFLLFLALDERDSLNLERGFVERYIKIINEQNVPYYPRSLFKLKASGGNMASDAIVKALSNDQIKLTRFDTHTERINFTKHHTGTERVVVDLGCGEFRHGNKIAGLSEKYIAIDIDPEVLEIAKDWVKRKEINNVEFYSDIDEVPNQKIGVVICSEVIEHMQFEDAVALIKKVLTLKPEKVIITTPNSEFNVNYLFEDGQMRHPDHKFELTKTEFLFFMNIVKFETDYEFEYYPLGDSVDGVYCIHGGTLIKKNNERI